MKKIILACATVVATCVTTQSFAFGIPGLPNMYVSAAYGYGSNNIPTPSGDFRLNKHSATYGADAGFMMPLGPIFAGATVGYYNVGKTDVQNTNYRWTYNDTFFPIELTAGFKFPHSITVSVDAGMAFVHQDLKFDAYNPPATPKEITNITGKTNAWKKVVGARISYRLPMGLAIGFEAKYLMGDKPKAFDNNTPFGPNDKSYRNIPSEMMYMGTLSYQL